MDGAEKCDGIFRLVRLQRADQMQLNIGVGSNQRGPFALCLLNAILPKRTLACRDKWRDRLGWMRLRDGDERDVARLTPRDLRCPRNFSVNLVKTRPRHCRCSLLFVMHGALYGE